MHNIIQYRGSAKVRYHLWQLIKQNLFRLISPEIIFFLFLNLLVANGPQRASSLNVQYLAISSKYNPDGQLFRYGYPSTHYKWKNKTRKI